MLNAMVNVSGSDYINASAIVYARISLFDANTINLITFRIIAGWSWPQTSCLHCCSGTSFWFNCGFLANGLGARCLQVTLRLITSIQYLFLVKTILGSVVLVLLTRPNENGQVMCHSYWPGEGSQLYHVYEASVARHFYNLNRCRITLFFWISKGSSCEWTHLVWRLSCPFILSEKHPYRRDSDCYTISLSLVAGKWSSFFN